MPAPTQIRLDQLRRRKGADVFGQVFLLLLLTSVIVAFAMVGSVIWDVLVEAWDLISHDIWNFVSSASSSEASKAGVAQGIRGTLMIAGIVILTFPIGIGSAIYLEEYADDTRASRLIQVTVRNLAGVPSIVYGLLGLAVFANVLGRSHRRFERYRGWADLGRPCSSGRGDHRRGSNQSGAVVVTRRGVWTRRDAVGSGEDASCPGRAPQPSLPAPFWPSPELWAKLHRCWSLAPLAFTPPATTTLSDNSKGRSPPCP